MFSRRQSKPLSGHIEKERLRPFLPFDPVIVEAGAHIGTDTVDFAERWPAGHVHALEPVPDVYDRLVAKTMALANVTTYEVALASRDGVEPLHVSGGTSDGSSSLLAPKRHLKEHPTVRFDDVLEVEVVTLDTWAARHRIDRVDCMWLDMQGYELAALRASETVLPTVKVIVSEAFKVELYDGAPLWPELRAFLERAGFLIVHEEFPWRDSGNIVAARVS
jgi:FkbM family methyltransferase